MGCFSSGKGLAAGGTKNKRNTGPNAETKCHYHDDVIDDCSDDSGDDDGGGGKWDIMVGRYRRFTWLASA